MSEWGDVDTVDGVRQIKDLKVNELKDELDKRGLSRVGTKRELAERLRNSIEIERTKSHTLNQKSQTVPNLWLQNEASLDNDFIREYFKSQQALYSQQIEAKRHIITTDSNANQKSNPTTQKGKLADEQPKSLRSSKSGCVIFKCDRKTDASTCVADSITQLPSTILPCPSGLQNSLSSTKNPEYVQRGKRRRGRPPKNSSLKAPLEVEEPSTSTLPVADAPTKVPSLRIKFSDNSDSYKYASVIQPVSESPQHSEVSSTNLEVGLTETSPRSPVDHSLSEIAEISHKSHTKEKSYIDVEYKKYLSDNIKHKQTKLLVDKECTTNKEPSSSEYFVNHSEAESVSDMLSYTVKPLHIGRRSLNIGSVNSVKDSNTSERTKASLSCVKDSGGNSETNVVSAVEMNVQVNLLEEALNVAPNTTVTSKDLSVSNESDSVISLDSASGDDLRLAVNQLEDSDKTKSSVINTPIIANTKSVDNGNLKDNLVINTNSLQSKLEKKSDKLVAQDKSELPHENMQPTLSNRHANSLNTSKTQKSDSLKNVLGSYEIGKSEKKAKTSKFERALQLADISKSFEESRVQFYNESAEKKNSTLLNVCNVKSLKEISNYVVKRQTLETSIKQKEKECEKFEKDKNSSVKVAHEGQLSEVSTHETVDNDANQQMNISEESMESFEYKSEPDCLDADKRLPEHAPYKTSFDILTQDSSNFSKEIKDNSVVNESHCHSLPSSSATEVLINGNYEHADTKNENGVREDKTIKDSIGRVLEFLNEDKINDLERSTESVHSDTKSLNLQDNNMSKSITAGEKLAVCMNFDSEENISKTSEFGVGNSSVIENEELSLVPCQHDLSKNLQTCLEKIQRSESIKDEVMHADVGPTNFPNAGEKNRSNAVSFPKLISSENILKKEYSLSCLEMEEIDSISKVNLKVLYDSDKLSDEKIEGVKDQKYGLFQSDSVKCADNTDSLGSSYQVPNKCATNLTEAPVADVDVSKNVQDSEYVTDMTDAPLADIGKSKNVQDTECITNLTDASLADIDKSKCVPDAECVTNLTVAPLTDIDMGRNVKDPECVTNLTDTPFEDIVDISRNVLDPEHVPTLTDAAIADINTSKNRQDSESSEIGIFIDSNKSEDSLPKVTNETNSQINLNVVNSFISTSNPMNCESQSSSLQAENNNGLTDNSDSNQEGLMNIDIIDESKVILHRQNKKHDASNSFLHSRNKSCSEGTLTSNFFNDNHFSDFKKQVLHSQIVDCATFSSTFQVTSQDLISAFQDSLLISALDLQMARRKKVEKGDKPDTENGGSKTEKIGRHTMHHSSSKSKVDKDQDKQGCDEINFVVKTEPVSARTRRSSGNVPSVNSASGDTATYDNHRRHSSSHEKEEVSEKKPFFAMGSIAESSEVSSKENVDKSENASEVKHKEEKSQKDKCNIKEDAFEGHKQGQLENACDKSKEKDHKKETLSTNKGDLNDSAKLKIAFEGKERKGRHSKDESERGSKQKGNLEKKRKEYEKKERKYKEDKKERKKHKRDKDHSTKKESRDESLVSLEAHEEDSGDVLYLFPTVNDLPIADSKSEDKKKLVASISPNKTSPKKVVEINSSDKSLNEKEDTKEIKPAEVASDAKSISVKKENDATLQEQSENLVNFKSARKVNVSGRKSNDDENKSKKKKWGTSSSSQPSLEISSKSLKSIMPDVKPLDSSELKLEEESENEFEEVNVSPKLEPGILPDDKDSEELDFGENEKEDYKEKHATLENVVTEEKIYRNESSSDTHSKTRRTSHHEEEDYARKVRVVEGPPAPTKPFMAPARNSVSRVVYIQNLVRPFTINQLRELLQRTGRLVQAGFWIDHIKSKCLAMYETEDQATETRIALHGVTWPVSNPKKLIVDYGSEEELQNCLKESSPPLYKTIEAPREERRRREGVVREWDLVKMGEHSPGEKEREKERLKMEKEEELLRERLLRNRSSEPPIKETAPPKLLDDLFKKTTAQPSIYWLPLTAEQITEKEAQRRQKMIEHERLMAVRKKEAEENEKRRLERQKEFQKEREKREKERKERAARRSRSRSRRSRSPKRSSRRSRSPKRARRSRSRTPKRSKSPLGKSPRRRRSSSKSPPSGTVKRSKS